MADTKNIASRMEKLAQLKRMKQGLSAGGNTAKPTEATPEAKVSEAQDAYNDVFDVNAPAPEATANPSETDAFVPSETTTAAEAEVAAETQSEAENTEFEQSFMQPETVDEIDNEAPSVESELPDTSADFSAPSIEEEVPASENDAADAEVNFALETADDSDTAIPDDLLEMSEEPAENNQVEAVDAENEAADENDTGADLEADLENVASPAGLSAEELGIDDEAMGALDEIAAIAGVGGLGAAAAVAVSNETSELEETAEVEIPDFAANEIDEETLKREFEAEASAAPSEEPETASSDADVTDSASFASTAAEEDDGLVTIKFDESRSTLLNHVSRQMSCSVDDVVVTALDWYLDALFGEDGEDEAKSA